MTHRPPSTEAELWPVPRRLAWLVFAAAGIAHLWVLDLPFQLDDFRTLSDPLRLFRAAQVNYDTPAAAGYEAFMLRWTVWLLWGGLAEFGGDPISAVPFHLAALLLHGATAATLAVVVGRFVGGPLGRGAGILAGLGFGLGAGGIQVVSWTSANADLLVALFGIWGLRCFLKARDPGRAGPSARAQALAGAGSILLALLSKTPALVLIPTVAFLLWADRHAPRRAWRRDVLLLLIATLITLGCRWLYLGSTRLRYGRLQAPELWEAPTYALRGLANVGQGLFPWNRSPLFDGQGPLLGEWVLEPLGVGAPLLGWIAAGSVLVYAWLRCPLARRTLVAGLGGLMLLALPGAVLYGGHTANELSRTVYIPLLAVCGIIGVACAHLVGNAATRKLGRLAVIGWALLVVDGTSHVARTETLAALDRNQRIELVREAHRQQGQTDATRPLTVLAVVPEAGYGGIPSHGMLLPRAFEAPYWVPPPGTESSPLEVKAFTDRGQLARSLYQLRLGARSALVIGPSADADAVTGAKLRAEWWPRAWTELRQGMGPAELDAVAWSVERFEATSQTWRADPPVPPHALDGLRLRLPPGGSAAAHLVLHQGASVHAVDVHFDSSPAERVTVVKPPAEFTSYFGAPIEAFELQWEGDGAGLLAAPELLSQAPRVELLCPAENAELAIAGAPTAPAFEFRLPTRDVAAPYVRFEMVLFLTERPIALFHDVRLDELSLADGRYRLAPEDLHADGSRAPGSGEPTRAWAPTSSDLQAALRAKGWMEGYLEWRVSTLHPGGAICAQSPWRGALFKTP